jgi:trans-aconitate 2-methyltransferase
MIYRWNPADYHDNASAQTQWAEELISRCQIMGTERVLDMGCGDGRITAGIARQVAGGSATGLDLSREMVAYARKAFPAEAVQNLSFVRGDITSLPFGSVFDMVVSNSALHWIPDQQGVLAEVSRVLRPGGRLLVQMGGKGNAAAILAVFSELMQDSSWKGYFGDFPLPYVFCSPGEYRDWLDDAGLDPLTVRLTDKDMAQKGSDGLAGWIRTTWHPYLERIPGCRKEEFITEICSRYLARHPPNHEGMVHVAMVRLEVEAEKPE